MPEYEFECKTHGRFPVFFKTFPAEAKQKAAACPDCDQTSPRIPSTFSVVGAALPKMEKVAGPMTDASGRPYFKDVNGNVQEIRSSKDVDKWCTVNALGKPRLVEYRNPVTGVKSMQPMREGGMRADPTTGEPLEDRPMVRESEKLVPLDGPKEFQPPEFSRTGMKLKNGVLKTDPGEVRILPGVVDPETKKPITLDSLWQKDKVPG